MSNLSNLCQNRPLWCPLRIRFPPNLHTCKKWVGIVVYASIAEKEPHALADDYHVYLKLNIGNYQVHLSEKYVRSSEEPHQLLFVYIPRAEIIQEFTQTSQTFLNVAFGTDSPGGEVQRRGIEIVGFEDQAGLEEFVDVIIHCMQRADTLKLHDTMIVEKWIQSLRLQGDLCTPNKRYSRIRWEMNFELLSQKYREWDWSGSAFCCIFFGDEFQRKKWFMHFNEGNFAEIQLPLNMLGDPNWLGIAVCAIHWKSHEDEDNILYIPDSDSNVLSWHLEFDVAWDRFCTFRCDHPIQKLKPRDLLADWTYYMYVPRTDLKLRRQRHTAKATFWSSCPCLGVRRCALRLVYKEDIEDLVQSLTLCELP